MEEFQHLRRSSEKSPRASHRSQGQDSSPGRSSVLVYLQHRINLWHEEERRRLARNEQILRDMEQVERRVATITTYLQKMKHTKNEYEEIFMKGVTWSDTATVFPAPPQSNPYSATEEQRIPTYPPPDYMTGEQDPSLQFSLNERSASKGEASYRYYSDNTSVHQPSPRTVHSLSSGNIHTAAAPDVSRHSPSPRVSQSLSSGNIYTPVVPQEPSYISPAVQDPIQAYGNPSEEYEQPVMKSHSYPTVIPSGKTIVPVSKGQDPSTTVEKKKLENTTSRNDSKVAAHTEKDIDMNTSRDDGSLLPEDSVPLRQDSGEYTESTSEKAEPLVTSHNGQPVHEPTLNSGHSQAYEETTPKEYRSERKPSLQVASSLGVPQEQGVVYINRTPSPMSKEKTQADVRQRVNNYNSILEREVTEDHIKDNISSSRESSHSSEHNRASVRSHGSRKSKSLDTARHSSERRRSKSLSRHESVSTGSGRGVKYKGTSSEDESVSKDSSYRSTSRSQDAYMKLLGLAGIRPTKMEEEDEELEGDLEDMLQNPRSSDKHSSRQSDRKSDHSSGSSRSRSLDRNQRLSSMRSRSQSLKKSLSEVIPAQIVSKMPARLRKLSSFRMESDTESVSVGHSKADSEEDFGFGD